MKFFLLLFLCITPSVIGVIRKMEIIWLNNGGKIMSNYEDWIKLQINTPNLNNTIICTQGNGYTYRPGDTRRFYNLWFPVQTFVSISLTQYNFFSKDDAVYIESPINSSQTGFYQFKLTLQQFRLGVTIGLTFEGFGISISIPSYTQYADYYMLLRLNDLQVANNTYGLESTCHLKNYGYYHVIQLVILLALFAVVI